MRGWAGLQAAGSHYNDARAHTPGATNEWKVAEPQASAPKGNWWEMFGDTDLNQLETNAIAANQQLKAAVAAFDQARALTGVARAGYYPHFDFAPSATRQENSRNEPANGAPLSKTITKGFGFSYNDFTAPIDLNYEVDLWGRVRRTVESARSQQQASADDLENIKLSIEAEVATDYFTLRSLDAQMALLRSDIEVFQKSLDLTKDRRAGGVATDLDVAQAETVLRTTQAELPATLLQRAQFEHALAVLVSQPASTFSLLERQVDITPPVIPPGLPSALLERRPDISAAERRMASANANIGVAKAAFFPTILINGLGGFESLNAGTVFNWQSRFWSLGPSLTLPLFEGGQNVANLHASQAAYEQAIATYRQTVLSAFAEVEDSLASQNFLSRQFDAENEALVAARKQFEIATNRYKAGLVTFLDVATAQSTELNVESTTVQLRGQQLAAAVALVKSLGGGWQDPLVTAQSSNRANP